NHRQGLWKGVAVTLVLYVGLCGASRHRAETLLNRESQGLHLTSSDPYVFPEALGFYRFHGVLRDGATYRHYQINVLSGRVEFVKSYETVQNDPRLIPLLHTSRLLRLMKFFKRPVFEWSGPSRVRVFDLRFLSTVLP